MTTMNGPAVYVGTYHKYNCGSIAGQWLELEDYADWDDFMTAARELHKDEADPELMFQDYQCFPETFYGESWIKKELWDWLELNDEDKALLDAYQSAICSDGDIDQAREAFAGKTTQNRADFYAEWMEDTGGLEGCPEHLQQYLDFDAMARDSGMTFHRGDNFTLWVFYER